MANSTKYCSNCGAQIDVKAEICTKCGVRVAPPPMQTQVIYSKKNATLAGILSFLITGVGQLYIGQIGRGLLFLIGGKIVGGMFGLLFGSFGLLLAFLIPIFSAYDAYSQAIKYNQYLDQNGKPLW